VVNKEPSPSWLKPRSLPQATAGRVAHAQDGVAYLLTDWQLQATREGYDSRLRGMRRATGRTARSSHGSDQGGCTLQTVWRQRRRSP